MKTKREKPKKSLSRRLVLAVDGVINHLLLIFAALIFLFGFYALWDSNQVYSLASSSEYEAYRPVTTQQDELASFSGFSKLQELNPEVLGWINVYGTNIDYPLVQAKDNESISTRTPKVSLQRQALSFSMHEIILSSKTLIPLSTGTT
ncbi:sortase [Streptococcus pneumoniae]|nr:sortase [Streptococcus pneumoniae]